MLPALLVAAPVTVRFAFSRARLAQDVWGPAYKLSSGRLWWRCLRFSCSRGELHPCAERLAKHLSWHLGDRVGLTNIREVLGSYASYHHLSLRTAWTDWGRLVEAGWLASTRAPANQGRGHPQGPGSGRAARYVLTAPAAMITQLRSRSRRRPVTALDPFSLGEVSPSPSVPPPQQDQQRGWVTLRDSTMTERRDASALLAGCQELWRRQRPNSDLLTRRDWHHLLPLVAQVHRQHPEVPLTALLTDRVRSARHLPSVLAWRLWRVLRQSRQQQKSHRPKPPPRHTQPECLEEPQDWHQYRNAVRTAGGPAVARAVLAAKANARTGERVRKKSPERRPLPSARHFPH